MKGLTTDELKVTAETLKTLAEYFGQAVHFDYVTNRYVVQLTQDQAEKIKEGKRASAR